MAAEVNVTNSDKAVLDWLCEIAGGSVVVHSPQDNRHRATWRALIPSLYARRLLAAILPWMRIKRRHAEILLAFYAAVPEYKERHPGAICPPLDEPLASLYAELRALNRRGPPHA